MRLLAATVAALAVLTSCAAGDENGGNSEQAGTNIVDLPVRHTGGMEVAWSPDGTRMAIANIDGLNALNLDGSNSIVLDEERVEWVSWSPDGSRLAYVIRSGEFNGSIGLTSADGLDRTAFLEPADGWSLQTPVWSPDGRSLAWKARYDSATFIQNQGDFVPKFAGGTTIETTVVDDPDAEIVLLTEFEHDIPEDGSNATGPSLGWPNSDLLLFTAGSAREGTQLWSLDPMDGSEPQVLGSMSEPSNWFSPDGTSYAGGISNHSQIQRFNLDGTPISTLALRADWVAFSADGSEALVISDSIAESWVFDSEHYVFRVNVADGTHTALGRLP